MRCHPMCLQRVHYSVSVAFVGSVCCSLVVLGVPSLSPLNNCLSTELSGSRVTGAWGRLGAGGSWLGCRLGRPVGCSSALGLWLQLQPPSFLGTYPPIATWALTFIIYPEIVKNTNEYMKFIYFSIVRKLYIFLYCTGIAEVMGLNGGVCNKWLNSISSLGKIAAEVHNFFKNKLSV